MKTKKVDALHVWKQIDDEVVPRLRLSPIDRAAYCYLLRHSRLEERREVRFSIPWLARGIRLSAGSTRPAVRRLLEKGALRLVQRTKAGHVVEVHLPEEIPAAAEMNFLRLLRENDLEEVDFFQNAELREAIHAREGGRCFFCLRRVTPEGRCLDHVVPQVQMGRNSYRNLVSSCLECNSQKGERSAADFLRWLFREGKLTTAELKGQLRALEALAAGKLRPEVTADFERSRVEEIQSRRGGGCKVQEFDSRRAEERYK